MSTQILGLAAIGCCPDVQAVHHVAPGPDAWPALARCTALAELCLVLPYPALADRFAALPDSLTRLKASGVNTLQVMPSLLRLVLIASSAPVCICQTFTCRGKMSMSCHQAPQPEECNVRIVLGLHTFCAELEP